MVPFLLLCAFLFFKSGILFVSICCLQILVFVALKSVVFRSIMFKYSVNLSVVVQNLLFLLPFLVASFWSLCGACLTCCVQNLFYLFLSLDLVWCRSCAFIFDRVVPSFFVALWCLFCAFILSRCVYLSVSSRFGAFCAFILDSVVVQFCVFKICSLHFGVVPSWAFILVAMWYLYVSSSVPSLYLCFWLLCAAFIFRCCVVSFLCIHFA